MFQKATCFLLVERALSILLPWLIRCGQFAFRNGLGTSGAKGAELAALHRMDWRRDQAENPKLICPTSRNIGRS